MSETSEMVKRVALAMREADPLGKGYRGDWPAYASTARAAIAAMREPTDAMITSVYSLPIGCIRNHDVSGSDLLVMWQMMIDEALR